LLALHLSLHNTNFLKAAMSFNFYFYNALFLTPSKPGFQPSTQFARVLRQHNSTADCVRELFNPSKDRQVFESARKKHFFDFGFLWVTSLKGLNRSLAQSTDSYGGAKWHKNSVFKVRYICTTLAVNVLKKS